MTCKQWKFISHGSRTGCAKTKAKKYLLSAEGSFLVNDFLSVCLHLLEEARECSGAPFIDPVTVEWRIFLAGSHI